jgi:hypothetical protein
VPRACLYWSDPPYSQCRDSASSPRMEPLVKP